VHFEGLLNNKRVAGPYAHRTLTQIKKKENPKEPARLKTPNEGSTKRRNEGENKRGRNPVKL
jgi:hypothetical protein